MKKDRMKRHKEKTHKYYLNKKREGRLLKKKQK